MYMNMYICEYAVSFNVCGGCRFVVQHCVGCAELIPYISWPDDPEKHWAQGPHWGPSVLWCWESAQYYHKHLAGEATLDVNEWMLDGGDCRDADASSTGAILAQSGLWKFSSWSVDWSDSLYVPSLSSWSINFLSQVNQRTYRSCSTVRKTYSCEYLTTTVSNSNHHPEISLSFCLSVGPLPSCLALPGLVGRRPVMSAHVCSCLILPVCLLSCKAVCLFFRFF